MKIALCFSGQLRDLSQCSENIDKNIIEGNDVDVFMHGWWDKDLEGKRYKPNSTRYEKDADKAFEKAYKPVGVKFEKQKKFDFSKYDFKKLGVTKNSEDAFKCMYHMTSMWYSTKESLKLAFDFPRKYDFYIRCRTDLMFKFPIRFEDLNKNILYIGDGRISGSDRFFSDWFACGNKRNMTKYSKIYQELYNLNKNGVKHMHEFVREHLVNDGGISCDTTHLAPHLYYFWKTSGWLNEWLDSLGVNSFPIPQKKPRVSGRLRFNSDNNF